jgi:uncharacterized membrane protein YphA (DoxX/SURF4 family)
MSEFEHVDDTVKLSMQAWLSVALLVVVLVLAYPLALSGLGKASWFKSFIRDKTGGDVCSR